MIRRRSGNLSGLFQFQVEFRTLRMTVLADKELQIEAHSSLTRHWREIQQYLSRHPEMNGPHPAEGVDPDAPEVAKLLLEASCEANVPPLLVVDGAVTEKMARDLRMYTNQILIENGPEVHIQTERPRRVRIFAGGSSLSSRLVLEISPESCPAGLSTHCCSDNLQNKGKDEDAAVALCSSASMAAAFAAGAGERLAAGESFSEIHEWAARSTEVLGLLLIRDDIISKRGAVHLVGG